ncbi:uncharacterized protein PHACADRAFT_191013 [Phanerochaete carnosa HHB-10118-sp]|uniref:Uncharacterized protein n=1 Tax=Phanerochaete carnosa (strain HHB-10118-sp) TaxID=650164 RepID=K5XFI1_PHACS|nr:uncharacterized protein PHACADRAFT_191013 [Phanerochaete carnosa HHB-10118-sp]EKM61822.1 hypothetical protein PHACADRAFT_191013 [Phanerochaete carnosa HHB-10118-sp]
MRDPPSIIDDSHVILPSEAAAAGSSTESAELPAGDVEPASSLATGLSASATSASSAVPENDKAPLEARIDQPTSEANVQSEIALTAAPEEPDGPTNLNERGDRPARAAAHADAVPSFESPDVSALFETANAEGGAIQEQLPPLEGLPLPVIGSPYLPTPPLSAYVDRPDPLSMLASGRPPSTKGSDNDSAAAGGLPENRAVTPFVSEPPPGDSSAGEPFQESPC